MSKLLAIKKMLLIQKDVSAAWRSKASNKVKLTKFAEKLLSRVCLMELFHTTCGSLFQNSVPMTSRYLVILCCRTKPTVAKKNKRSHAIEEPPSTLVIVTLSLLVYFYIILPLPFSLRIACTCEYFNVRVTKRYQIGIKLQLVISQTGHC